MRAYDYIKDNTDSLVWNRFADFDELTDKQKESIIHLSNKAYLYQFPYWSVKDDTRLMIYADNEEVFAYSVISVKKIPFINKEVCRICYGPVFREPADLLAHLQGMTESLPASCLALEINPYSPSPQTNESIVKIVRQLGFESGSTDTSTYKTTLHLALDKPMEEIRASFRRSLKTQLNRALKSGVDVVRANSDEQWEEAIAHYNNFAETSPVHFISQEETSIIKQFKDQRFHLFSASLEGNFLGCLILYSLDDHVVADWLVVTEEAKEQKLPVTHCLHWQAINWAKSAGFINYDFAGYWQDLGNDDSINRFKLGFTKQEVSLSENYTYTNSRTLLEVTKKIHQYKMSHFSNITNHKPQINKDSKQVVESPDQMADSQFTLSVVSPQDLNAKNISAWIKLEDRAAEANAFLSPLFVLPAIKYLDPDKNVLILLVENKGELAGVGVFYERGFSVNYPFRHLVAYKSIHSYLSGLLIDSNCQDRVIKTMFDYFSEHSKRWGTVFFEDLPCEGQLIASMNSQTEIPVNKWWSLHEFDRACLQIVDSDVDYISKQFSSKKRGDLRRLRRRLAEKGDLEWRCVMGKEVDLTHINDFLVLEHSGWKPDEGSSLLASETDTRFFIDVVQKFAEEGRVLFSELTLDGKTIASACNFISGKAIFAYKLGWDPAYSKFSPSILNLLSMTENISSYCSQYEYFDSGSVEGSFMEKIWAGRRPLANGYFSFSRSANLLLSSTQLSKDLLRRK